MAGGWAGFSEQELRRLQGKVADVAEPPPEKQHRPPSVNKSYQQLQRKKAVRQLCEKMGQLGEAALAPPEQRLSVSKKSSSPQITVPPSQSPTGEQQDARNQQFEPVLEKPCNGEPSAEPSHKLVKKKIELQEKSRWEVFQQEQRLMEEKNKRKKVLLANAIAERSKRTQAETVKLNRIQKQLQALDEMVSADIGILRNRIDQASLDYSYARKRYDKAEAEYVDAKLDLQKKTEIKEQLTEHLCTIIQQNELRKAKKLEGLMQQLEVEADEETLELEIEVEQMLQQQDAEAARPAGMSQKLSPVGMENSSPRAIDKECENKDHIAVVSKQLMEQPPSSHTSSQGQSIDSASREMMVQNGT
ncbi:RAB6-interacting golgin isoform X2 [Hemicordylus capensis]|uniref:RAB6-interacting golgin isoform X2 n=1 Tax=Hemicordylus capensis TaxID=884348 RepID=UPI002303E542|nr:RAB6-interacting golgin isoform X2 [Hemicordylus capensis]